MPVGVSRSKAVTSVRSPDEVQEAAADAGMKMFEDGYLKNAWLAFFGGCLVALGAEVYASITGKAGTLNTTEPGVAEMYGSIFWPVGIVAATFLGGQIFTTTVTLTFPVVASGRIAWWWALLHWANVLFFNFLGALTVAFFLAFRSKAVWLVNSAYLGRVATSRVTQNWGASFLLGVGGGYLSSIGLYWSYAMDDSLGKLVALWWPNMAFHVIGFQHVVVDAFYCLTAFMFGSTPYAFGDYVGSVLIPVALGHLVGGPIFVGLAYFAAHLRSSGSCHECGCAEKKAQIEMEKPAPATTDPAPTAAAAPPPATRMDSTAVLIGGSNA